MEGFLVFVPLLMEFKVGLHKSISDWRCKDCFDTTDPRHDEEEVCILFSPGPETGG